VPAGQGSGFVWDNNGHIVTNYHVVQGGSKFQITFHADKKQYDAKIVATEPTKDIAVLKIIDPPKNITPISVSESSKLIVGQKALAIGHPFELDHTLTTGIVSALGRKIRGISNIDIHDMIQTDCSINPGNSGGPLLDSSGKLIGMNTMIYSQSGSSAGVGFAVPSDTISRIVPQLIKHKKVIRPTLGIQTLSSWQQERFGIEKGVVVKSIADNSPAEEAGIRGLSEDKRGYLYLGDVIESVDGKEVNNFSDIYNAMDKYKFGDTLKLEIRRNDKLINLKVRLKKYSD
jgi:S1-C subfamily serine protease